jgi:hypothetical protein
MPASSERASAVSVTMATTLRRPPQGHWSTSSATRGAGGRPRGAGARVTLCSRVAAAARSGHRRLRRVGGHEGTQRLTVLAGRAKDPAVADEMAARGRDDADEAAQERDGLHDEVGAPVGPRPLELVGDAPVVGPREALLRERGPRAVPAQPFERGAIVGGEDDGRLQREAFAPRAGPLDAGDGRSCLCLEEDLTEDEVAKRRKVAEEQKAEYEKKARARLQQAKEELELRERGTIDLSRQNDTQTSP